MWRRGRRAATWFVFSATGALMAFTASCCSGWSGDRILRESLAHELQGVRRGQKNSLPKSKSQSGGGCDIEIAERDGNTLCSGAGSEGEADSDGAPAAAGDDDFGAREADKNHTHWPKFGHSGQRNSICSKPTRLRRVTSSSRAR